MLGSGIFYSLQPGNRSALIPQLPGKIKVFLNTIFCAPLIYGVSKNTEFCHSFSNVVQF